MEKTKDRRKKQKKHKKQKKAKKQNAYSSSDSDSETEWMESAPVVSQEKTISIVKRDDWMQEVDSFGPTYSKNDKKESKSEQQEKIREKEKLGQHERELNPYWKQGGDGLPSEIVEKSQEENRTAVGDGGLNWLRKAYKRVMEQAAEEGRSPDDVAAERWGSLDKLKQLLQNAEEQFGSRRSTKYDMDDPPSHKFYSSRDRKFKSEAQRHHSKRDARDYREYSSSKRTFERKYSRSPPPKDFDKYRRRSSQSPSQSDSNNYRRRSSQSPSQRDSNKYRRRSSQSPPQRDFDRYRKDHSSVGSDKKEDEWEKIDKKPKESQDSSSQKLENLFVRPVDEDDSEGFSNFNKVDIKTNTTSFNYARTPSWKKKEFIQKPDESNSVPSSQTDNSEPSSSDKQSDRGGDSLESSTESFALTDQEMNELGAKLLKAELMGNNDLAKKLKDKLEKARKAKTDGDLPAVKKKHGAQEEVILLTKTDNKGMTRPLVLSDEIDTSANRRKKQKVPTHESGSRVRYFPDDDRYSLKQMFEKEKLTTAEDQNAVFAALAGKSMPKLNADFDVDDAFISKANTRESQARLDARERLQAIGEHKKKATALEKCNHCFGSSNVPKHLIISIGKKVYLRLPSHVSLNEGHCFVVPMSHTTAGTYLDEDVLEEIKVYKKALTEMFAKMDQDVVFFEMSKNLKYFPHMILECVPIARDVGDVAAIYFKKAILECESEWANNKKVVDYKNKPIGRVVPKGLPYFCVEFGLDGGFAHVIEDEQSFPKYFAQEIIGGMLDVEPRLWRNPPKQKFEDQSVKVLKFAEWWKPYEELISPM